MNSISVSLKLMEERWSRIDIWISSISMDEDSRRSEYSTREVSFFSAFLRLERASLREERAERSSSWLEDRFSAINSLEA